MTDSDFFLSIRDEEFVQCRQLLNSKPNAEYGWEFFTQTKTVGDCVIYRRYRRVRTSSFNRKYFSWQTFDFIMNIWFSYTALLSRHRTTRKNHVSKALQRCECLIILLWDVFNVICFVRFKNRKGNDNFIIGCACDDFFQCLITSPIDWFFLFMSNLGKWIVWILLSRLLHWHHGRNSDYDECGKSSVIPFINQSQIRPIWVINVIAKCLYILKCPLFFHVRTTQDIEYRPKWDSYCLSAKVVEEQQQTSCIHWEGKIFEWLKKKKRKPPLIDRFVGFFCSRPVKLPWPLKNRDYVYYRKYRMEPDGAFLMISRGGHHSSRPEAKSFIRVENYFNIMAIRQRTDRTNFVLHYYDDLKSHIPKALINW